jgi:hypothetical protein
MSVSYTVFTDRVCLGSCCSTLKCNECRHRNNFGPNRLVSENDISLSEHDKLDVGCVNGRSRDVYFRVGEFQIFMFLCLFFCFMFPSANEVPNKEDAVLLFLC